MTKRPLKQLQKDRVMRFKSAVNKSHPLWRAGFYITITTEISPEDLPVRHHYKLFSFPQYATLPKDGKGPCFQSRKALKIIKRTER